MPQRGATAGVPCRLIRASRRVPRAVAGAWRRRGATHRLRADHGRDPRGASEPDAPRARAGRIAWWRASSSTRSSSVRTRTTGATRARAAAIADCSRDAGVDLLWEPRGRGPLPAGTPARGCASRSLRGASKARVASRPLRGRGHGGGQAAPTWSARRPVAGTEGRAQQALRDRADGDGPRHSGAGPPRPIVREPDGLRAVVAQRRTSIREPSARQAVALIAWSLGGARGRCASGERSARGSARGGAAGVARVPADARGLRRGRGRARRCEPVRRGARARAGGGRGARRARRV